MSSLADFNLLEQLHDSPKTAVWRVARALDGEHFVAKIRKAGLPDTDLRHEYRVLSSKSIPMTVPVVDLFFDNDQTILIREDCLGQTLDTLSDGCGLSLTAFLNLAIAVCRAVESVHSAGVIHCDLTPTNILFDIATQTARIFDFGLSRFADESEVLDDEQKKDPDREKQIVGELDYISPELTGRVDRKIDRRSDYYSLGCLFYRLLAGRPPFASMSSSETIHAHVALTPPSLHDIGVEAPAAIESIIKKLLCKDPNDRYQTAGGLINDWQRVLSAIETGDRAALDEFVPGAYDHVKLLRAPKALYGREAEITRLMDEFDLAADGDSRLILIAGYSGAGKTALARQLASDVKTRGGFFASGKFEEYRRNMPYFAIAQAIGRLCETWLLAESEELTRTAEIIQTAVGQQGQALVDIVPALETIIGRQPELLELGSQESQNRMDRVFQQFFAAICREDRPVLLFIDDLQWADFASLRVLTAILAGEVRHLLLIGSYRDNEVDKNHILNLSVEALKQMRPEAVSTMFIDNLSFAATEQLVAAVLDAQVEPYRPLAKIVYEKTRGNPFYTIELLKLLHAEQLLVYDRSDGVWVFDEENIRTHSLADNVVDVVIQKIGFLPETTLESLKIGACVGREFSLRDITEVRKIGFQEALDSLDPALADGVIGSDNWPTDMVDDESLAEVSVFFLHDRLQEGSYRLISPEEAADNHKKLGQALYRRCKDDALSLDLNLMAIVEHLNEAIELLDDEGRKVLAELNHQAGLKAKGSSANAAAIVSLETAMRLFGETGWKDHYDSMISAAKSLYVCYYLVNDYEKADRLFEVLKREARTPQDRFDSYYNRMVQCMVVTDFVTTIETGRQFVELLGHRLPTVEEMAEALSLEEDRLAKNVERYGFFALLERPELTDQDSIFYARALIRLLLTGFFIDYDLFRYTASKTLNLAFDQGIFPEIEVVLADYVLHLLNLQAYEQADEVMQIAKKMADKTNGLKSEIWHFQSAAVDIWVNSWDTSIKNYYTAMAYCAEEGNQEYTGYALDTLVNDILCKGQPLSEFEEAVEKALLGLVKIQHFAMVTGVGMYRQFIKCLRGQTVSPTSFDDGAFSEAEYIEPNQNNGLLLAYIYGYKSFALYANGDYQAAYQAALLGKPHRDAVGCFHHVIYLKLFAALVYPTVVDSIEGDELAELVDDWDGLIAWFDRLGALNPGNFLSQARLVRAERAAVDGDFRAAIFAFEDAIELAEKQTNLPMAAFSCERLGRYLLSLDRRRMGLFWIRRSFGHYRSWGATFKLDRLRLEFPGQIFVNDDVERRSSLQSVDSEGISQVALDSDSILKAAYALSGEIVLGVLMDKLLQIVIESAGADFAALLLVDDGELIVEVAQGLTDVSRNRQSPVALDDLPDSDLPQTVLHYVARSQQQVLLNLPDNDHMFVDDPYLASPHCPRSMLCAPVVYRGSIICLLYLENHQMSGVFTQERVELLHMIAMQAGVAIQNASLYSRLANYKRVLDERIKAYTEHMGTLIAGIAHEVSTPLGISVTAVSHLQQELEKISSAFAVGKLSKSQLGNFLKVAGEGTDITTRSLERAVELVQNFRRVSLDQSVGEVKTFDLIEYLHDVLYYLKPILKKSTPTVNLIGTSPLMISSQPGAFSQIVTNLVNNSLLHAFESMAPGEGKIDIEVRLRDDETVTIVYRDNGCGMEPTLAARIFEPLFTTKRGRGGSGLGGHIIHSLVVEQLGGVVTCESEVGKGTTFTIDLPRRLKQSDPS